MRKLSVTNRAWATNRIRTDRARTTGGAKSAIISNINCIEITRFRRKFGNIRETGPSRCAHTRFARTRILPCTVEQNPEPQVLHPNSNDTCIQYPGRPTSISSTFTHAFDMHGSQFRRLSAFRTYARNWRKWRLSIVRLLYSASHDLALACTGNS